MLGFLNGAPEALGLFNSQQQHRFNHELEGVDLLDGAADFGFGDWFYREEQRQALFGRVRFLLHGVDVHAFAGQRIGDAGDDAALVVDREAQIPACGFGFGGEVELARP